MIVHFFPYEKFTLNYISFINNNFNLKEHYFILHGSYDLVEINVNNFENVIDYEDNQKKAIQLLDDADAIIIHSLFIDNKFIIMFNKHSSWLPKAGWVVWGGDLHSFIGQHKSIKSKGKYFLLKRMIKKLKVIIVLASGDYDILADYMKINGKRFTAVYGNGNALRLLKKIEESNKKNITIFEKEKTIKILIGNSATETNHHREVFKILEKYKEEPIRIIVPLSYGDKEYGNEIVKLGFSLFGDKFEPLLDFMEYEAYLRLLSTIDVAIFNNNRQQALGNIRALAYFKTKLYMRLDTSMGKEFDRDFRIRPVSEIVDLNFNEFKHFSSNDGEYNKLAAMKVYDETAAKKQWKEIFDYLSK